MTLDQFITKHNGKFVDFDGSFGAQCVDLMRAYTKEVFGFLPYTAIPTRGNAKDIFKNFVSNKYFKKVLNTPTGVPKKGDIIFFGTYPFLYGWAGHVAIFTGGDMMNIFSFDQNYPTGQPCKFVKHSYNGCLGWLTPVK